jgi:hypothetical protein
MKNQVQKTLIEKLGAIDLNTYNVFLGLQGLNDHQSHIADNVLSKREQFAMTAMQGLVVAKFDDFGRYSGIAEEAVDIADALIAALEKGDK